jgi:hypothetical protein
MAAPKLKMRSIGMTDLLVQLGLPDFYEHLENK